MTPVRIALLALCLGALTAPTALAGSIGVSVSLEPYSYGDTSHPKLLIVLHLSNPGPLAVRCPEIRVADIEYRDPVGELRAVEDVVLREVVVPAGAERMRVVQDDTLLMELLEQHGPLEASLPVSSLTCEGVPLDRERVFVYLQQTTDDTTTIAPFRLDPETGRVAKSGLDLRLTLGGEEGAASGWHAVFFHPRAPRAYHLAIEDQLRVRQLHLDARTGRLRAVTAVADEVPVGAAPRLLNHWFTRDGRYLLLFLATERATAGPVGPGFSNWAVEMVVLTLSPDQGELQEIQLVRTNAGHTGPSSALYLYRNPVQRSVHGVLLHESMPMSTYLTWNWLPGWPGEPSPKISITPQGLSWTVWVAQPTPEGSYAFLRQPDLLPDQLHRRLESYRPIRPRYRTQVAHWQAFSLVGREGRIDVIHRPAAGPPLVVASVSDLAEVEQVAIHVVGHIPLPEAEPDINATDPEGNSRLLYAAAASDRETVADLLSRGATVDLANPQGLTPLMVAIQACRPPRQAVMGLPMGEAPLQERQETIELLIAAGADLERRDARGMTPLRHAIAAARPALVQRLLEVGAPLTEGLAEQLQRQLGQVAFGLRVAEGNQQTMAGSPDSDNPAARQMAEENARRLAALKEERAGLYAIAQVLREAGVEMPELPEDGD